MNEADAGPVCPLYHHGVEMIGRRWTAVIISAVRNGANRFSEITKMVPGLSDRLLSERLKELEAEGILERVVVPSTPVRIEYNLTDKGQDLAPVMRLLSAWAHKWSDEHPPEKCDRPGV